MARVLVTGGTGFIGSHLVKRLLDDQHEVAVLTRDAADPERATRVPAPTTLVEGDVRDPDAVRDALDAVAPDWVFHAAGAVMAGGKAASAQDIAEVNLFGTVHLLDELRSRVLEACVLIGDAFEYGPANGQVSERRTCAPTTLDGVAKLGATLYAQQLSRDAGLPAVVVRLFSVYGVGDSPRRLVPQVVERALDERPILLTRPHIVRDYVFIDDVMDLLVAVAPAAARLQGAIVNGGSGTAVTLGDIVDTVLQTTGSASEAQWGALEASAHDEMHPIADPSLARDALGWVARTSLEQGVQVVVADALRRRARGPDTAAPGE
jgi:nucleoside-diphosphate-sugar epimerase